MPATYSINIGQITESSRRDSIFSVLKELPNNTQKQITPRDVRDAFLSTWANSSFKITTPGVLSTKEYIGVDSGNPDSRDIKNKIFLGKRQFGNLDIMTNNLLSSDTDIFFYNTKADNLTQSSTKLSILASTNSGLYEYAPYIESKVNDTDNGFELNIKNPSLFEGPINVTSLTGRVAINGIVFPTLAENSGSASNGKILRYSGTYPNGYLRWDLPTVSVASIGVTGQPTNIYGTTVSVNGYPIEFIENSVVPITVGDIAVGSSFSAGSFYNGVSYQNWPMTEVVRKILYPYLPPVLTLSCDVNSTGKTFAEVGTTPSITITYSVTHFARKPSENISQFVITTNQSSVTGTTYTGVPVLGFSGPPGSIFTGTASLSRYSTSTNEVVNFWSYASSNGTTDTLGFPFGFSHSAITSMQYVSPIVAAFVPTNLLNFDLNPTVPLSNSNRSRSLSALVYGKTVSSNKIITPYPGLSQSVLISATGIGYLYFCVPTNSSWGGLSSLSMVKDPNGYIIHDQSSYTFSALTYSSGVVSTFSPFSYYGTYRIYRTNSLCAYYGSGKFELTFGTLT